MTDEDLRLLQERLGAQIDVLRRAYENGRLSSVCEQAEVIVKTSHLAMVLKDYLESQKNNILD